MTVSPSTMTRLALAPRPSHQRSRITNGSALLVGVDGTSAQARRYRDLMEDLAAEHGPDLSVGDRLLIRNAASLQLHAEELTAQLVRGEKVDPEAITRAVNGASRALAGLKRRQAKPKGKGNPRALADFLARKQATAG